MEFNFFNDLTDEELQKFLRRRIPQFTEVEYNDNRIMTAINTAGFG